MVAVSIALAVGTSSDDDKKDSKMCDNEMALVLNWEDGLGCMSVVEIVVKGVSSPSVPL